MKTVYWILAVVFVLFTIVQYNDPDPIPWMLLYGSVGTNAALAALGKPHRRLLQLSLLTSIVWALTLVPDFINWIKQGTPSIVQTMKAETPWVELTREFLGLCLAASVNLWLLRPTKSMP